MDVLSQLFSLLFRGFVILLPLTTGWLAMRRLVLSRSANAWIYATTCLFAVATAAGLVPWTLGVASAGWMFFLFAAFCPALWIGVIMLCDGDRLSTYEADEQKEAILSAAIPFITRKSTKPLLLENPDWPDEPSPMFRHQGDGDTPAPAPETPPKEKLTQTVAQPTQSRTLITVAREMRGNVNSEARRPKLLPPPELGDLSFLPRA